MRSNKHLQECACAARQPDTSGHEQGGRAEHHLHSLASDVHQQRGCMSYTEHAAPLPAQRDPVQKWDERMRAAEGAALAAALAEGF